MELLNDDFNGIVEIFENAIIKELEVIKTKAEELNDKSTLGEIDAILKAEGLITYITNLTNSNDGFLRGFIDCYNGADGDDGDDDFHNSQKYKKYSRAVIFCAVFIDDLLNEFNMFCEGLNKNENEQITIKNAICYVKSMNALTEIIKKDEDDKFGISIFNAAEAYQYIANNDVKSSEIGELKNLTKARWKYHLKLDPIGKGRDGAQLYKLNEMANFVHSIEIVNISKLLKEFHKRKEEPSAPL